MPFSPRTICLSRSPDIATLGVRMNSLISPPLARTLHRVMVVASYASAVAGLYYFVVTRLAFDYARTENRLAEPSRAIVGDAYLLAGMACLGLGVLALLAWLLNTCCADRDQAQHVKPAMFLAWLPWLALLGIFLSTVMPK